VIPSEELKALDVFLCVCLRSLKSISQALVVVIVFFGALLRHAIQSSVLSFLFLTFHLEVATDVVLKSFPNSDYSNSSS